MAGLPPTLGVIPDGGNAGEGGMAQDLLTGIHNASGRTVVVKIQPAAIGAHEAETLLHVSGPHPNIIELIDQNGVPSDRQEGRSGTSLLLSWGGPTRSWAPRARLSKPIQRFPSL